MLRSVRRIFAVGVLTASEGLRQPAFFILFLAAAGMNVERVYKVKEGRPNVVDFIKGQRIQLVINTPTGQEPWFDEKAIRRAAVMARIPTITTLAAARAAAEGIAALQRGEITVHALQQLHAERAMHR